ncbi:MAG: ROK family protein, partial [bacterium]
MSSLLLQTPKLAPVLDPGFRPAVLGDREYGEAVRASGRGVPLEIALQRNPGAISVHRTQVFPSGGAHDADTLRYAERLLKFLLWQKGGHRIIVAGPAPVVEHLRRAYAPGGARAFDAEFMGRVYEKPFSVEQVGEDRIPEVVEPSNKTGGHLDGCRIGFDAGASDRKVAAVIEGKAVWSEEVIWHPRDQKDPAYHHGEINSALKAAAARMPRVDAIGVSSAGVYINNRVMVASLFRGIPRDLFEKRIKPLFMDLRREWGGIPLEVANDGDVTALAGAMTLGAGAVLGIAMGSSEAAGWVTPEKCLPAWLSELAFAPIDYRDGAPVDEWSGDAGCGVQYFSQVGAIRLAAAAGLPLPETLTPAEKLKEIQEALSRHDERAANVFRSIGTCLGYALARYAEFYDVQNVLILGRVTSGAGGTLILGETRAVLAEEFPG